MLAPPSRRKWQRRSYGFIRLERAYVLADERPVDKVGADYIKSGGNKGVGSLF
jgi:hypothetical protein